MSWHPDASSEQLVQLGHWARTISRALLQPSATPAYLWSAPHWKRKEQVADLPA
eukprot:CAMPEP_0172661264 /NCGR_PEP_ID=MMETSP1074-20121228/4581_1 /TAXON_ID=2916 /ORGANISM="Ceratium fusus, Strain PA161109" /LENGTH=53 /DNA_ID=CAMNT_0013477003 /DNA_START=856 /DNA_END=1017 /DNA_ORIENTATION=-